LETVKTFQITSENYPQTLERLKAHYDSPTLVFIDNISTLFALPGVSKPNEKQLRSLIDNASALYNSSLSLVNESDITQLMLISIIFRKVDQETNRKWNESFITLPTWDNFVKLKETTLSVPRISPPITRNATNQLGQPEATPTEASSLLILQLCSSKLSDVLKCGTQNTSGIVSTTQKD